jgi:hypothetical protein
LQKYAWDDLSRGVHFLHAGRKIMHMLALFLAVWAWPKGLFLLKKNLAHHQSNKVTCRSKANPLPLGLKF